MSGQSISITEEGYIYYLIQCMLERNHAEKPEDRATAFENYCFASMLLKLEEALSKAKTPNEKMQVRKGDRCNLKCI